jgi:hypothetical protein
VSETTSAPPVRTGRCTLILVIDGKRYRLSAAPPVTRGSKIWHVKVLPGQERSGRTYSICSFRSMIDCTCPDSTRNGAACKHVRALQALGIISKRSVHSVMARWEASQEMKRPRKKAASPQLALPAPAPPPSDPPRNPVLARRRHIPLNADGRAPSQADPADGFAVGWKNAVLAHLETMRTNGGAS